MSYEDECNEYYFGIPFNKRVPAAEVKPKFKVGDRVVASGGYSFDPSIGTVVEAGGHYYGVRLDAIPDGYSFDVWNYGVDDHLSPAPTIAIGDRVKLKRHFGPHAMGDDGKVRELITKAGFVNAGVEMDPWGVYTVFPVEVLEAADCAERKEQPAPKFRVGDWVRCLTSHEPGKQFTAGRIYEVREVPVDGHLRIVSDDRGSETNGWGAHHFEPYVYAQAIDTGDYVTGISSAPTQPCIVARVLDGQPRPSNIPFVHASSGEAMTEASRLARNNPGQEFAVYQRVGARVAVQHIEMKEVA